MFDMIDATGLGNKNDPRMRDVEAEMIRSHELCLNISSKKPTDPDYKALLEELFQCEIDDSVAIVSPFYCDCGCRMNIGKRTINSMEACPLIFFLFRFISGSFLFLFFVKFTK